MTGNENSIIELPDYVPEADPVESEKLIGVHYFPGWKPGSHQGWEVLKEFPERKPLLGYYDESNPEVTDWEIKWALEHGIQFFIYCWYRRGQGVPVTRDTMNLEHAIHEGLFNAKYRNKFKFTIMWENQRKGISSVDNLNDLMDNVFSFWMEQYFKKEYYLKINNKIVLFVYRPEKMIFDLGGIDKAREGIKRMRKVCKAEGFDGLIILGEHRGENWELLKKMSQCGFDYAFAYCWHAVNKRPTISEAFERQFEVMKGWKKKDRFATVSS